MRASTLFVATFALLIGLGVALAAKYLKLFQTPPQPELPQVPVLVAARNIFADDVISGTWVRVRNMRPGELKAYQADPSKFLPAVPEAAALRVAGNNIEADRPILRDDLKKFEKPTPLNERLLPTMRAVNVDVAKERSAGGLIQVGEWVDVNLTTAVSADGGPANARTATIAPSVRVIAKRQALWNIFAPLPDDQPVAFTLEVNPYRAALIEFSKAKGYLSLVPVSVDEKKSLEAERRDLMEVALRDEPIVLAAPREERDRAAGVTSGRLTVGNNDLMRIFNISTPEPKPAPSAIERFNGTEYRGRALFDQTGRLLSTETPSRRARPARSDNAAQAGGVQFGRPEDLDCPECQKKKKKARRNSN